ncbi:site-specific DNA-methyltransferase [Candidatus Poribacteria bacterium]|nr:MAG: site-specific DNA-methyltransferase [Candidatus Poribacteria bacterium]
MDIFDHSLRQLDGSELLNETYIKIISEDARNALEEFEPNSVHLVVTDPPYFLDGLDTKWRKGKPQPTKSTVIGGLPVGMKFDPQQGLDLQLFMEDIGGKIYSVLKPGSFALFFSQPRLSFRMSIGLEDAGFEIRDLYAWRFTKRAQFKAFTMDHFIDKMDLTQEKKAEIKQSIKNRRTPQLRPQFEAIILAQKPKEGTHVDNWLQYETGLIDASQSLDGNVPSTIMTVEKPKKDSFNGHLTVKPMQLIEYLIKLFSKQGQVVLDPFLGSGTTAVACHYTGRSCIGIEINQDYVDIAKQRLKEHGYEH